MPHATETLTLLIIATPLFLFVYLLTTYLETGTVPDLRQKFHRRKKPKQAQVSKATLDLKARLEANGNVTDSSDDKDFQQKKSVGHDNTLEIITSGAQGVPQVFKGRILHRFHELFESDR